eukprot:3783626-Amphidinium_carterae.1
MLLSLSSLPCSTGLSRVGTEELMRDFYVKSQSLLQQSCIPCQHAASNFQAKHASKAPQHRRAHCWDGIQDDGGVGAFGSPGRLCKAFDVWA